MYVNYYTPLNVWLPLLGKMTVYLRLLGIQRSVHAPQKYHRFI